MTRQNGDETAATALWLAVDVAVIIQHNGSMTRQELYAMTTDKMDRTMVDACVAVLKRSGLVMEHTGRIHWNGGHTHPVNPLPDIDPRD